MDPISQLIRKSDSNFNVNDCQKGCPFFSFVITTTNIFPKGGLTLNDLLDREPLRRKSRSSPYPSRQHVNHGGREGKCVLQEKISKSSVTSPPPPFGTCIPHLHRIYYFKGTGSPDRIQMLWQKWILLGLT